jgi:hypothetical protein
MTEQQYQASMVKAASMGFAQSLINRGATPEQAAALTHQYADPNNGLLMKRANKQHNMVKNVAAIVNAIRQNY